MGWLLQGLIVVATIQMYTYSTLIGMGWRVGAGVIIDFRRVVAFVRNCTEAKRIKKKLENDIDIRSF